MCEKKLFKATSGEETAFPGREKMPGKMQHGALGTNGACRRSPLAHDVFSPHLSPVKLIMGEKKAFLRYFRTRKSSFRPRKDAGEDAAQRPEHRRVLHEQPARAEWDLCPRTTLIPRAAYSGREDTS